MFISNIQKKTLNNNAEKSCLCQVFGQKEQKGLNTIVEQQIKKTKNYDVKKLSKQEKKISVSEFKKMAEQSIVKNKKLKLSEFKNKQKVVVLDHPNKQFISQSHNQFQKINKQQNHLRVPILPTNSYFNTFISPKNVLQRKIIQHIMPSSQSQINCYDSYSPQKRVIPQRIQRFLINPMNKSQIKTLQTPKNYVQTSRFYEAFRPMKQYQILSSQIQESKKSKQGILSNESTQFHKQSSYHKYQKNNNFSFQQSELYLQESEVFISQTEAMCIIPEKSGFLRDYKSIESINNTLLDENSFDVSFTIDQPKNEKTYFYEEGIRYQIHKPA